ncbi:unnamed protein product [Staurois parvus]|uniref:Uncharacterized protein n=1 Tax=Staurois parvus TaxID=386267 RepID=A0ABN9A9E8_9NEOB|nr:unnamed protein product [Staurois parvus]
MVHSTYRHRTSIRGMTDLMIKNVMKADNTSFHCFVVVKLCAGDNQYEDEIQYGGGTRLIISGKDASTIERHMLLIIVSSGAVLIILLVILIVLTVKGVICKKKTSFSEQQMNTMPAAGDVTSEEGPYCEIGARKPEHISVDGTDEAGGNEMENRQMEDGADREDGSLLYAKLNKEKLKEKHPAENPKQNEEVLYAAVVKTTSE